MFSSSKKTFSMLEENERGVIEQAAQHYNVSAKYVEHYIGMMYKYSRKHPMAHRFLDAELGLYNRIIDLLKYIQINIEGKSILDIGSGTAHVFRAFKRLNASRVVGLENDKIRVGACKIMLSAHRLDDIEVSYRGVQPCWKKTYQT